MQINSASFFKINIDRKTILAYAFFRGVPGVRHSHSKRFSRDGPGFDQRLPAKADLVFLGEDRGTQPGGRRPKPAAPGIVKGQRLLTEQFSQVPAGGKARSSHRAGRRHPKPGPKNPQPPRARNPPSRPRPCFQPPGRRGRTDRTIGHPENTSLDSFSFIR